MEAVCSSETSADFYWNTHVQEDNTHHVHSLLIDECYILEIILKLLTYVGILSFVYFVISFWSQIMNVLGDACVVADCERTVKEVIDRYGQLDVLVSLFRQ
jgi:hypothetical protein